MTVMINSKNKMYHPPFKEDDIKLDLRQVVNWKSALKTYYVKISSWLLPRGYLYYKENHTLCVWSKKTFRDGEKKTSNDIIKVAGNRKNYNQRRTLNER